MMFSGSGNYTSPDCDKNYDPPLCTKYFRKIVMLSRFALSVSLT